MLTLIIFAFLAFIIGYIAFYCYILCRIIRKFDNTVTYREMLIPFWNIYLFYKTTLGRPLAYYCFWGSLIYAILCYISIRYADDEILKLALGLLGTLIGNTPKVLIAEKLGKNFWLYFALLVAVPALLIILPLNNYGLVFLLDIAVIMKLAFDSSTPETHLTADN